MPDFGADGLMKNIAWYIALKKTGFILFNAAFIKANNCIKELQTYKLLLPQHSGKSYTY